MVSAKPIIFTLLLVAVLPENSDCGWFKKIVQKVIVEPANKVADAVKKVFNPRRCCNELGGYCFDKKGSYSGFPLPKCYSTGFKLYRRGRSQAVAPNNIPSDFDVSKKTVFIVHGWRGDTKLSWVVKMRDALLAKEEMNVITVDWNTGSKDINYLQAASNARAAGKAMADFLTALIDVRGMSVHNSQCNGFSLGAHVCGFAGHFRKFGRISGIDPAGPTFDQLNTDARLSEHDAYFVDCIHTDGGGVFLSDYGSTKRMGHVDFYPNGGKRQPGCAVNRRKRGNLGYVLSCSHYRAVWLYISSINKDCFQTTCQNGQTQRMGYYADKFAGRGRCDLSTTGSSPYCK